MNSEDVYADEVLSLKEQITADLDKLAQTVDRPTEVDPSPIREVDISIFDSFAWVNVIVQLQDWLRLENRIDADVENSQALRQIVVGLGESDVSKFLTSPNQEELSLLGLEVLADRLEKAVNARNEFLETLNEQGQEAADAKWLELWEDEFTNDIFEPVHAEADVWRIKEFLETAEAKQLDLAPSYQRADVWATKDAQILIESILQGIPLPSVILLKPGNNPHSAYEVVDGKQRLTAILRFTGKHPEALRIVAQKDEELRRTAQNVDRKQGSLLEVFQTDYPKFRKMWKSATGETLTATLEKERYFPFKLPTNSKALDGKLSSTQGKYYSQIKEIEISIGNTPELVRDVFNGHSGYKIPLIIYRQATPKQIHRVFNIYNKQGKHLIAEEIRNAVYNDVELLTVLSTLSGDNPNPSLIFSEKSWLKFPASEISTIIEDYNISQERFKRTKLLSWIVSILLSNLQNSAGNPQLLSTAKQIDSLLEEIQSSNAPHRLKSDANLKILAESLLRSFNAHGEVNAWPNRFKNSTGKSSWQELQLVASLLGVTLAEAVLGESLSESLIEKEANIKRLAVTEPWIRPSKTQTKTQWQYIARVSLGILDELGLSREDVSNSLQNKYGVSPMNTLIVNAHWPV